MRRLLLIVMLASCEVPNPRYDGTGVMTVDSTDTAALGDGGQGAIVGLDADPSTSLDGPAATGGVGGGMPQGGMQAVTPRDALAAIDAVGGRSPLTPDAGSGGIDAPPQAPASLIAHLPLTELSGTAAFDASGWGNNGRLQCVGPCSNGVPMRLLRDGRRGVELAYYQAIDIVSSPSINSITADFSFFVWANRIDQVGVRALVSRLANDGNSYALHFYFDSGRLGATVGAAQVIDSSTTPPFSWHHVGVVRRAGVITLFRDSMPVASAPCASLPAASTPFLIGASAVGAYNASFADAIVNNLTIYNRSLLDAEVVELFNGRVPR